MKGHDFAFASAQPPFADAVTRVRAEFLEMPGMQLTLAQAARLCHLEPRFCETVLTALVDAKFLARTRNERFARA
jgi:hypothetical protein